ncbi:MAG: exodeoxyribonuclease VII large subunit [Aggregatilineales bacterium]
MDVYSVSGVTAYIRGVLEMDEVLRGIGVKGEVSNVTKARSGHWYFTLKDASAQLRIVMFRTTAARQKIEPEDGMMLQVQGRISVYEARGEYQLIADAIETTGTQGDLYAQFEALKAKLDAEGLFNDFFKKPIPAYPQQIAVVTSPDAAAFQDIQNVLRRRYPIAEVILSPTLVQGTQAAGQIVRAIERVNQHTSADILLLCRGGGSIEDLWSFNEERVARAVVDSKIPVISGVGHESDFTIVDFVADKRAPTPSAAAELATPDGVEIREALQRTNAMMTREIQRIVRDQATELQIMQQTLEYVSPGRYVQDSLQRIDEYSARLSRHQKNHMAVLQAQVAAKNAALETLSPQAVLARGYAIVSDDNGTTITDASQVQPGTGLQIRLKQGQLRVQIEEIESDG